MYIESKNKLKALYAAPKLTAIEKEISLLDKAAIDFINASPFVVVSTFDSEGKINISPRGGIDGFVNVIDMQTIIIPDAKGNNRLDSLYNIIDTGKIGCLFIQPNVNETLRINGIAKISVSPQHLSLDFGLSKPPQTCLEIKITDVFLHCSKSLVRSKLW